MEIKRITKTVHTDKGIDLGIPDIELPPSSILQLNNSLNYKNKEANRNVSIEDFNLDNENILNTSSAEEINTDFSTYDLSDEQVKKIARLCVQEQGTVEGAAAEASLMANLFEVNNNGKYDGQTGSEGLYDYIRNSGWFANASYYMDNGSSENKATDKVIDAVKKVLVDGKRTLPKYINQHDDVNDLEKVSNNGKLINKNNKKEYVRYVSKCKQSSDSFGDDAITWTYYCHPSKGSDPFGYDNKKLKEKYGNGHYDFKSGEYTDE